MSWCYSACGSPDIGMWVCRKRQQLAQQGAEARESKPPAHQQQQHAQIQQAAQQQRLAAHRKHLEELAQRQHQDPADVTPAQAKHRKEFRDSSVVCLSTEIEQGNVEYKYRLTGCITNENRQHQLVSCAELKPQAHDLGWHRQGPIATGIKCQLAGIQCRVVGSTGC